MGTIEMKAGASPSAWCRGMVARCLLYKMCFERIWRFAVKIAVAWDDVRPPSRRTPLQSCVLAAARLQRLDRVSYSLVVLVKDAHNWVLGQKMLFPPVQRLPLILGQVRQRVQRLVCRGQAVELKRVLGQAT